MNQAVAGNDRSLSDWLLAIGQMHPDRMDLGLDRVRKVAVCAGLLPPQVPVINVAGTNGKGTTVHCLENIYQAAGYKTGAYTSPHLLRYNERIRLDGKEAADDAICSAFQAVEEARGEIPLTSFEFSTLAALHLFRQARVDILLLEVGLGGRLDAVNILDADVALITSIGLDHQQWLGGSRAEIAREKSGIMRPGRQAIYGENTPESALLKYARERSVPLWLAGRDYRIALDKDRWHLSIEDRQYKGLPLSEPNGAGQRDDHALAVAAVHALQSRLPVSTEKMVAGLRGPRLPGRFQVLEGGVQVVFDVAHNAEAGAVLAENLRRSPVTGQTICVIGMLDDKPVEAFVQALQADIDQWFACGLQCERGLCAEQLYSRLRCLETEAPQHCACSVEEGMRLARETACRGDRILVCGSFRTVAAVQQAGDCA